MPTDRVNPKGAPVLLCPNCGRELQKRSFCARCGAPAQEGNYCPRCGTPYEGPNNCPHCGFALTGHPAAPGSRPPDPPERPLRMPPKRSRWRRNVAGCGCLAGSAFIALIAIASAQGDWAGLALAVAAALLPVLVYSRVILSLDRYEIEPTRAVLFAFGWGAVGAVLFSLIAELIFAGLVLGAVDDEVGASTITVVVGAPFIEEACKGLALLLLLWFYRHEFDNVVDGIVYGALIGLGFAMTENVVYFLQVYHEDGLDALGELFVVRAILNGFGHSMYTGVTGAAVGWARSRHARGAARFLVPVVGYLLAVLLHGLWNGGTLAVAGAQGDDATIWSVMLVEVPLFVIPPLILLSLVARRAGNTELTVMQRELAGEVDIGVLSQDQFDMLTSVERRREEYRRARARGGVRAMRERRRLFALAGDLAFRKYHLSQGERPTPHDREEIQRLRTALHNGLSAESP